MQKRLLLTFLLTACVLSGCLRPYSPSVQQGNVITTEMVAQLKPGMSQDEVQYILGAPILLPAFGDNRWDYVYTFQPKNKRNIEKKQLSVYFNNQGRVVKIQDQLTPEKIH